MRDCVPLVSHAELELAGRHGEKSPHIRASHGVPSVSRVQARISTVVMLPLHAPAMHTGCTTERCSIPVSSQTSSNPPQGLQEPGDGEPQGMPAVLRSHPVESDSNVRVATHVPPAQREVVTARLRLPRSLHASGYVHGPHSSTMGGAHSRPVVSRVHGRSSVRVVGSQTDAMQRYDVTVRLWIPSSTHTSSGSNVHSP